MRLKLGPIITGPVPCGCLTIWFLAAMALTLLVMWIGELAHAW